jgi:lipocalin
MEGKRHIQSFNEHQENLNISDVSGSLINESWRIIDMEELYDYINKDRDEKTFIKPKFPTRRWGQVYTKTSTTDVRQIDSVLGKLRDEGFEVRKKLEKENQMGKFYQIEINNHTDRLVN